MTTYSAPPPAPPVTPTNTGRDGRATGALVLGIISLAINPLWITSILGGVLGILVLRKGHSPDRGKALGGVVLSAIGVVVAPVVLIVLIAGGAHSAASTTGAAAAPHASAVAPVRVSTTPEASVSAVPSAAASSAAPSQAAVPVEYKSALVKAQEYVDTEYMSKAGLYDQLTSKFGEQFSKKAGEYAVDHVKANWDKNALVKAKDYQSQESMSPAAIHDQLTSKYGEKFTEAQADYAIKHLND